MVGSCKDVNGIGLIYSHDDDDTTAGYGSSRRHTAV